MGVDYNTYVGCYIEITNSIKTIPVMEKICCKSKHNKKDVFCSYCGKTLTETDTGRTTTLQVSMRDILGDIYGDDISGTDNYGCGKDPIILISNMRNDHASLDESDTLELTESFTVKCKSTFLANDIIRDAIKKCEDYFGVENVKVKFGVVTYCG